ncbi:MAG: hypothetical protein N4A71_23680 [Carboxylicivirga sp.]|jgi:hypothetical protein|nr:hypothetical protein [Carboxylicivirga sp.]MCT4645885.1 hypothetical protein [Carboxylicivirga sp.]
MTKEYRIILAFIFYLVLNHFVTNGLEYYIVLVSILAIHSIYRQSTLFKRIHSKGKRYFIKSKFDKPNAKKNLAFGVAMIVSAIVFYILQSNFKLDQDLKIIIIYTLAIFGLSDIVFGLFLKPIPITEIIIGIRSVDIYRNGRLVKEIFYLNNYNVSNSKISFETMKTHFELDSLEISTEQINQLTNDLHLLVNDLNDESRRQKKARLRFKKYFSFKTIQ